MKGKFVRRLSAPAVIVILALFCNLSPGFAESLEYDDAYERLLEKYADVLIDMKTENIQNEDDVVVLPSRYSNTGDAESPEFDEESSIVSQWLTEANELPNAGVAGGDALPAKRPRRSFTFGHETAKIVCRTGMITDVELEPGERVERYVVSDPDRWSVSAAWSGELDNMVTHVLLKTQFPGLKMNAMIYTDRRTYSLDVESSETAAHTPYVTFNYLKLKDANEEEEIPSGEWRDLLKRYDLLSDDQKQEISGAGVIDSLNLIDGADIYSGYLIKPYPNGRKKIAWLPIAVYDANGLTYIVMPKGMKFPGAHSLDIERGGKLVRVVYKAARKNLYVVDRLFDFGVLTLAGDRVEIRRQDSVKPF
ncbi:MAG: TrbG/VirB9 family P-type conjugative transfer protein [Synergistaceae bacterium]|jgi:type IV secretory pathway VirB9-like protein|nr:TrbG/VirB9 family P-type conjugative transfer protein [Synergistaceae bacterium]